MPKIAKTGDGLGCGAAPIFSAAKSNYVQRASNPIANWMVEMMVYKNKKAPREALVCLLIGGNGWFRLLNLIALQISSRFHNTINSTLRNLSGYTVLNAQACVSN